MRQFSLKVSYEHDSDVVLTARGTRSSRADRAARAVGACAAARRARGGGPSRATARTPKNRREAPVRRLARALRDAAAALGGPLPAQPRRRRAAAKGRRVDRRRRRASLRSKLARSEATPSASCSRTRSPPTTSPRSSSTPSPPAACPVYYGTRDVSKVLPRARAVQVLDHPDVPSLARKARRSPRRPASCKRVSRGATTRPPSRVVRRLRNATAAATTATKPQHFCAVCEAVRAVRARDPGHGCRRRGGRRVARGRRSSTPELLRLDLLPVEP